MADLTRKQEALEARGLVYTHAYLIGRIERHGGNPAYGEFLTDPSGEQVLRNKLMDVAWSMHYLKFDDVPDRISFVMASLAGEPDMEILLKSSTGAAGHVSWAILTYLGYRCEFMPAKRRNHKVRNKAKGKWMSTVNGLEAKTGVCQKYSRAIQKHWKRTGVVDDTDLKLIQYKHGAEDWLARLLPSC